MSIADVYTAERAAEEAYKAAKMESLRNWAEVLRAALPRVRWFVGGDGLYLDDHEHDKLEKGQRWTGHCWTSDHCLYANLIDGYGMFITTTGGYCSVGKTSAEHVGHGGFSYTNKPFAMRRDSVTVYYQTNKDLSAEQCVLDAVAAIKAHRKGQA